MSSTELQQSCERLVSQIEPQKIKSPKTYSIVNKSRCAQQGYTNLAPGMTREEKASKRENVSIQKYQKLSLGDWAPVGGMNKFKNTSPMCTRGLNQDTKGLEQEDMDNIFQQFDCRVNAFFLSWKAGKVCKILYVTNHFLNDFGWFKLNIPCLKFACCCVFFQVSSKDFIKIGEFLQFPFNFCPTKKIKSYIFLDAGQINLQATDNIAILSHFTIETIEITFKSTQAESHATK